MYIIKFDLNPITRIRFEKGLTSSQLAEMAGLTQGRIAQVENGIRTKKVPKKLLTVVKQLGYEPEKIQQEYIEWLDRQVKSGKRVPKIQVKRNMPVLELTKENDKQCINESTQK